MKTEKRKIGDIGENISCVFLEKKGFTTLERNYLKKCGEIDIISQKNGEIHFIEVKTVSCENFESVSSEIDTYRPEDNLHPSKLKRLARTIEIYLQEKSVSSETLWQFDVIIVFLNTKNKTAQVRLMENIIL